jgi:hypothetical protein
MRYRSCRRRAMRTGRTRVMVSEPVRGIRLHAGSPRWTLAPSHSDEAHSLADQRDQRQSSAKHNQLGWAMVADQPHAADKDRQNHQRERQPVIEAGDLRSRPVVKLPIELAPGI